MTEKEVKKHLLYLTKVVNRATIGKIGTHISIPENESEFTELYYGIQLLMDAIEEKVTELEQFNKVFSENLKHLEKSNVTALREKATDDAILASINEGIVVIDRSKTVTLMNQSAERVLGWPAHEIIGKNWDRTVDVRDENGKMMPKDQWPLQRALGGDILTGKTFTYLQKNGRRVPVGVSSAPVILQNKIVGAVGVFRDVTEEREIDTAKTEVISFTSHQLRTPLSVINWYSEKMLSEDLGPLNQSQRDYLTAIYTTAKKTTSLVNTFLDVSRIQLGTFKTDPKKVNVGQIMHEVIEELQPKITLKKIKVITRIKDEPIAWADVKLTRIVLENLIGNAVKYTPEKGKVSCELMSATTNKEGKLVQNMLLLRIKDSGYGIPKKEHDKVFTKLYRGENVRERDIEGSGIGLYMVKSIVEHLNGDVWFTSKKNKGTTFCVLLPTAR